MSDSPFIVPPFSLPPSSAITYVWWSWHPLYPYWSESCWRATSIEEAQKFINDPKYSLDYYHNKLIEHGDRTFIEVQDEPCRRMDLWCEIKRKMIEGIESKIKEINE